MDPIGWKNRNWIKLGFIDLPKFAGGGLSPIPAISFCLAFDYWKTWLKLVMLENLEACLTWDILVWIICFCVWFQNKRTQKQMIQTFIFFWIRCLRYRKSNCSYNSWKQLAKNDKHQNFIYSFLALIACQNIGW